MDLLDLYPPESPPPPRKEDKLFRDDLADSENNACLDAGDDVTYSEGYLHAARCLVHQAVQTDMWQDLLVYPIIFLYRHHIELLLKRVILRAPHVIGYQFTETERRHLVKHRLDWLWDVLKPLLSQMCKTAGQQPLDPQILDGIDSYIRQLSDLDPNSSAFRYSRSRSGNPSLPSSLAINIRHFDEMMQRLNSQLSGIDEFTDRLVVQKTDWEKEIASFIAWE